VLEIPKRITCLKAMRAEAEKIAGELKKYQKVMAVILFGSHAKGKAKPLSDIDIAVIVKDPDKKTEAEIAGFSSNVFDMVNFHRLPLYIQFEVLKHGRPLFVRDGVYFSEIKLAVLREYLDTVHLYERVSERALA